MKGSLARRGDAGVSAVYDHLITNFNKEMMSFSDYPMPAHYPTYLPKKMVCSGIYYKYNISLFI